MINFPLTLTLFVRPYYVLVPHRSCRSLSGVRLQLDLTGATQRSRMAMDGGVGLYYVARTMCSMQRGNERHEGGDQKQGMCRRRGAATTIITE